MSPSSRQPGSPRSQLPEPLHPDAWAAPKGYVNGMVAQGRQVFIAGQIGWDGDQQFVSDDFAAQTGQALRNIVTILAEAGGRPEHIVRLTWYITDKAEYLGQLRQVGAVYREVMGRHFPTMTMVQVVALIEDRAKVEIEATAVIGVD
jgi:enamine deaminase RidA (YjgF/YER057c/UK114 family)